MKLQSIGGWLGLRNSDHCTWINKEDLVRLGHRRGLNPKNRQRMLAEAVSESTSGPFRQSRERAMGVCCTRSGGTSEITTLSEVGTNRTVQEANGHDRAVAPVSRAKHSQRDYL